MEVTPALTKIDFTNSGVELPQWPAVSIVIESRMVPPQCPTGPRYTCQGIG